MEIEPEALARALDYVQTNEPVRAVAPYRVRRIGTDRKPFYTLGSLIKALESRALVRFIPGTGWIANYQGPVDARPAFIAETYNRARGWIVTEEGR